MSRNEWEKGSVVIPSAEWASFKKAVREDVGRFNEKVLAFALELHAHLTSLPAAKRREDPRAEAYEFAHRKLPVSSYDRRAEYARTDLVERAISAVSRCDYDRATHQMTYSIVKPKKGDFGTPGNNVLQFSALDCTVTFDNETRTVEWETDDGNHSVESARQSHLGKSLFRHLEKVSWTRGTGGTFSGNDEYNEDADREHGGGGGSYVTERFGPVGAQQLADENRMIGLYVKAASRRR